MHMYFFIFILYIICGSMVNINQQTSNWDGPNIVSDNTAISFHALIHHNLHNHSMVMFFFEALVVSKLLDLLEEPPQK